MFEAIVTSTWLAAHTERMRVGSLVLCDSFRHPAVLARQAVSIDHASRGRYELGIGWGSVPDEFPMFGVGSTEPRARVQRLKETLEVVRALWAGEVVDYEGEFHSLHGAQQEPRPLGRIPIVIGGTGARTLALVREFADWWNLQTGALEQIEELRSQVGGARASVQQMVTFVRRGDDRDEVAGLAMRRFGRTRPVVGTAAELADHFDGLAKQGVERVYAWFTDFAPPETLAEFGEEVITPLGVG
jgi:alkanesulfonate monooxygenase SsuD/methylene tetrahydromethanopterin reductase-like flavin-dependent oxidoreductase (luciferase family)